MAKPLLEVLRDVSLDPTERAAFTADPAQYLAEHGYEDVPPEHLGEAFELMHDTLPADTARALTEDPVWEAPGDGIALDDGHTAAEVGDMAPFGEVNGDFDAALLDAPDGPVDSDDDSLDDAFDPGPGPVDSDDDSLDDAFGPGQPPGPVDTDDDSLDDAFEPRLAAGPADTDIDDLDAAFGTAAEAPGAADTDDEGLDDAYGMAFGEGSGDLPADDTGGDPLAPGAGIHDGDDFDGLGLDGGEALTGIGDPLAPDLDTDFGADLGGDDLGVGLDQSLDTDDLPDQPDDADDFDDIGSF